MNWKRNIRIIAISIALGLLLVGPLAASTPTLEYNPGRAKLLGYMLKEGLQRHHYSHKKFDNELSEAAFGLYLKTLDSQKRFLLKADTVVLEPYRYRIDDELRSGVIELPLVAAEIMRERLEKTEKLVEELLGQEFDFSRKETFESDPDKIDFAATEPEVRERWRKALKFQVLTRYLDLEEEEQANAESSDVKVTKRTSKERQAEARKKVLKSYTGLFSRLLKETEQDYFNSYLNAVSRAYDPHTVYLAPKMKEDFDISMSGSLEGIGATLREEDGYIKVVRIIPGSAAFRQGQLAAEDIILKVAQGNREPVDITDMRLRDAVSLIRGKKGTEVRLTVKKPDAQIKVIPIVRDIVQIEETFVKSTLLQKDKNSPAFGYIKIPSFYRDFGKSHAGGKGRNATDDVRAALEELMQQDVSGMIIDLRNDGGGALTDAVKIAGLFIKDGPVVQVKDSSGAIRTHEDKSGEVLYDGPLVVLVNQFSASSSEILAGALQDYGRAVIIGGEHTHGKGTVQAILDLDRRLPFRNMSQYTPLGALKVTIQKFYRVSGDSTQYRGVIPDIILPDRLGHLKTGEQYIDYSLPWDSVDPIDYSRWQQMPLSAEQLAQRSSDRVAANEEFRKIAADAELAREKSEQTSRSLLIDDMRRDRAAVAANRNDSPHGAMGGTSPHGEAVDEDDNKPADPDAWIEAAGKDPYIIEAQSVLEDIAEAVSPRVADKN